MNFIERVMRVMTHVNIGAALGLVGWMLWSGWQVVSGQVNTAQNLAEVRALMGSGRAVPAATARPRQMSLRAAAAALPPCHEATPALNAAAAPLSGADL